MGARKGLPYSADAVPQAGHPNGLLRIDGRPFRTRDPSPRTVGRRGLAASGVQIGWASVEEVCHRCADGLDLCVGELREDRQAEDLVSGRF